MYYGSKSSIIGDLNIVSRVYIHCIFDDGYGNGVHGKRCVKKKEQKADGREKTRRHGWRRGTMRGVGEEEMVDARQDGGNGY